MGEAEKILAILKSHAGGGGGAQVLDPRFSYSVAPSLY